MRTKKSSYPNAQLKTAPSRASVLGNGDSSEQSAQIDLAILPDGFVDVISTTTGPGDPRLTSATWTLRDGGPANITQPDGPDGRLVVKGPVDIDFNLAAGTRYRLAGITFRRVRGGGPANGIGNWPKEHIKITERPDGSSTVHVRNTFNDRGDPNTWNWDFFIFVQDEGGDIGIIDPELENQQ